ncbi:MAG: methanogenesis marker 3 protein [Methanosarcinales archaeon]|nr:methanogenesis marker 3 protein [Methanosarcinales archaeon]
MKVTVDGAEVSLADGGTLGDAMTAAGSRYIQGTIVGIIKGRSEKSRETDSYWLETSKGKLRIELVDPTLHKIWKESLNSFSEKGLEVRWTASGALAFGTFPATYAPVRTSQDYEKWEVVLGASGFEADKGQLIFIKKRHSGAYGVPITNRGVLARVVGGKGTMEELEQGDRILKVDPIVEWEDLTEKMATDDLSTPLEEGMEIFTRFEVQLREEAPRGAEFFLAATRDDVFETDALSSSYVSTHRLHNEPIIFEHREPRLEGVVTVRSSGRGLGKIFIYKADRTSNPGHSVVGRVSSGIDLVKLASPGQRLAVKVSPERFMVMGIPLARALEIARERGLECQVEGDQGEDAVVVDQSPLNTMDVLREGKVALKSIPAHRLVSIELFDDQAPKTLDYFRHVVGLKERPLGPLPVFFVYENTVLFKPVVDAVSYKELLPENKPTAVVPAGAMAVSNTVSKKTGLVGVKMVDDKRYGPSGEKFEGTNIIGRVIDLDKLKDAKEGETIYVLEVRK